jgi:hypothetical protein
MLSINPQQLSETRSAKVTAPRFASAATRMGVPFAPSLIGSRVS